MWFTLIREAVLVFTAIGAVAVVASDLTPEDVRAMVLDSSGSLINNTERQDMLGDVDVVASELIPDPEDVRAMVLDTSESLINNTERQESLGEVAVVASELTPDREDVRAMVLDSSGSLINNTERITEEEIDYDYWNSVEERGDWNCSLPNTGFTCGRAGGYCVRYNKDCDGILDVGGCRGKKCKCCLPAQTTPAPCTCQPCSTTVDDIISGNHATVAGHKYLFSDDPLSWPDADKKCSNHGYQLALLKGRPLAEAVRDYAITHYNMVGFWVGGSDVLVEGSWKWLDGTPFAVNFPWRAGEPNHNWPDENCLLLNWVYAGSFLKGYLDAQCPQKWRYICEIIEVPLTN